MGLFKNMKDAMSSADEAMKVANSPEAHRLQEQAMQQAASQPMDEQIAERDAVHEQFHEFQRINRTGQPAEALVKSVTDTGQRVSTLPVWDIELEVRLEGREPYPVKHREIAPEESAKAYPVGGTWSCHVDPADPTKVSLWATA